MGGNIEHNVDNPTCCVFAVSLPLFRTSGGRLSDILFNGQCDVLSRDILFNGQCDDLSRDILFNGQCDVLSRTGFTLT